MVPKITVEGKTYNITNLNYFEGVLQEISYYDDEAKLQFIYDVKNVLTPKNARVMDLEKVISWEGKNDKIIAEISKMTERAMHDYNELAHEIVDTDGEVKELKNQYYDKVAELATLHEVMKVIH